MVPAVESQDIAARTLVLERYRAVTTGFYEAVQNVFLLLILVRYFNGSAFEKSLVASAPQMGLLFAPLVIFAARRLVFTVAQCAAALFWLAGLSMCVASLAQSGLSFAICASLSIVLCAATIPLFTTIYAQNYSATTRGRDFSRSNIIRIGASIAFATVAGSFLSGNLDQYPFLLLLVALSMVGAGVLAYRLPVQVGVSETKPLFACFRYLKTDPILRETTVAWMLLGFAFLMMVPLRVEYLAHESYGLKLSEGQVAFLLSVVPNISRLISNPFWGRVFDKVDFFTLRIILNLTFLIGMLGFFASDSWLLLVISAAVFGIGTSGGDLAWNLWVTKFAPAEKVSDYMAVHVFFTGIRGILAPPVGFFLAQYLSLQQMSFLSAGMMVLSVFVLLGMKRRIFPSASVDV
jgi:MFS family permease